MKRSDCPGDTEGITPHASVGLRGSDIPSLAQPVSTVRAPCVHDDSTAQKRKADGAQHNIDYGPGPVLESAGAVSELLSKFLKGEDQANDLNHPQKHHCSLHAHHMSKVATFSPFSETWRLACQNYLRPQP